MQHKYQSVDVENAALTGASVPQPRSSVTKLAAAAGTACLVALATFSAGASYGANQYDAALRAVPVSMSTPVTTRGGWNRNTRNAVAIRANAPRMAPGSQSLVGRHYRLPYDNTVRYGQKKKGQLGALRNPTVNAIASPTALEHPTVWQFGKGCKGQGDDMKWLLGGKGANLAEMSAIGLSVPPGLTLTTEVCAYYCANNGELPPGVWDEVLKGLKKIEEEMNSKLGDVENPLLLSVRSGAAISMPGMMDTVLNLGLNDAAVEGLAKKSGNPRFAWDSYRRFLDMYGGVVMGIPHAKFEHQMEELKVQKGVDGDDELTAEDLKELVARFKTVYESEKIEFPQDPYVQLKFAINAVFSSWTSERADKYRAINQITGLLGTAVNVQAMAFGNMGPTSGTGVAFSRDPSTGENKLYGEYLVNAQGEDVVAGIRTPEDILRMEKDLPEAYAEFVKNVEILEKHYGDMQDMEFTVQEGKLYMLQTRSGKRTGAAAVRIAVELVEGGFTTKEKAINMVEATHLDQLLHPQFSDTESADYKGRIVAEGLPASPGAAVGTLVFNSEDCEAAFADGKEVILVRDETSPEDVGGMYAAAGILTARGGMTSHAAVVARGWGKPCVSGCAALKIDEEAKTLTIGDKTWKEGDVLSLNGATGEVMDGALKVAPPEMSKYLTQFMEWVDETRKLGVLANADTPEDAAEARRNGAEGIGLVRTEHMFFQEDKLAIVRKMILAKSPEDQEKALNELLPYQQADFEGIFTAMDGLPVTIRLLDPPLHEFLPPADDIPKNLPGDLGLTKEEVAATIEKMSEVNPMLGLRGCRLGVTLPTVVEMQARAIITAALDCKAKGVTAKADIMVPLIGTVQEFVNQEKLIRDTAEKVFAERGDKVDYRVGTMIEIPRAALMAGEIAKHAEFFSFGTNDLTQMTFGYSRDDVGTFLPTYLEKGILPHDPFRVFDGEGVGQLVKMATVNGRASRPELKVGVCGEQGGDPQSVEFFNGAGLDYVSCSPFRVPIARLAAAQATIKANKKK